MTSNFPFAVHFAVLYRSHLSKMVVISYSRQSTCHILHAKPTGTYFPQKMEVLEVKMGTGGLKIQRYLESPET